MEENMGLKFSLSVLEKLADKHQVSSDEVQQCFLNRDGYLLEDVREDRQTNPRTLWFIAETNRGRRLKVCFIAGTNATPDIIKTAYEPNDEEIRIYEKYGYRE